jgi:hypothetical protein
VGYDRQRRRGDRRIREAFELRQPQRRETLAVGLAGHLEEEARVVTAGEKEA